MEKFRVLIVDDDDDLRETLAIRLEARKLRVMGAESGDKALELLDRHDFDVVLLDIRMPGLDGIETLREMKKKRPLLEIILLTGHASVESGVQGMQLGAFDYVMKPASLEELLDKMHQAYEKKRRQEKLAT